MRTLLPLLIGPTSDERIAQLEREVARLRASQGEHPQHRWAGRP